MTNKIKPTLFALILLVPIASAQTPNPLADFIGKWKAMMAYTSAGGRFTVGLAEPVEVKQPTRNAIEFAVKPVTSAEPVFHSRLTYDASSKSYLFSVTMDDASRSKPAVLENLKLTYTDGTGFSGDGSLIDPAGTTHPVKVTVAKTDKGGYDWKVLDPSAPKGNDLIFSFTLFERIK